MRVKKLLVMALIALPTMVMAQSTYEPVGSSDNKTPLENKTVNPVYQQWLSQYVEVGRKINDISAQYQREMTSVVTLRRRQFKLKWSSLASTSIC